MSTTNESLEVYEAQKQDRFTMAQALAKSDLCPAQFRNKPADILIVMRQAEVLGCDPQSALSNMFVVKGTPGYSSKFLIAQANRHGVFDGPIRYKTEGRGRDAVVTAWARLHDGDIVEGIAVGWEMAEAAGWTKNPKYREMPELMYRYRSSAFLIRTTCPETTMGMLSVEELEDMSYAEEARDVTPEPSRLQAIAEGSQPESEPVEVKAEEPEAPEDDIDTRIMRGEEVPDGELFGDSEAPAEDPA